MKYLNNLKSHRMIVQKLHNALVAAATQLGDLMTSMDNEIAEREGRSNESEEQLEKES